MSTNPVVRRLAPLATLVAVLSLVPDAWAGALDALCEAYLSVSVFVAGTLALVYGAERGFKTDLGQWLTQYQRSCWLMVGTSSWNEVLFFWTGCMYFLYQKLSPTIDIDGNTHIALTQQIATIDHRDLSKEVIDLSSYRQEIIAALDFMISGI